MGFWTLFSVAIMPVLQVLLISMLGAFLATQYCNVLMADARKNLNKVIFMVFTPSLMFSNLAKSVTLEDIISWWFMPVNIGLTFLFGGILGWIVVKLFKPEPHLEGLVIACCSAGNLGNIMFIIIPAVCNEVGSPFGDPTICSSYGLSYASFSMALGAIFVWTYTYHLIRTAGSVYQEIQSTNGEFLKLPNKDLDSGAKTHLLDNSSQGQGAHVDYSVTIVVPSTKTVDESGGTQAIVPYLSSEKLSSSNKGQSWEKAKEILRRIVDELLTPPTIAAIMGFAVGATPWLKSLIVGTSAPLRVIQDSITLLGNGTIPCITLILGGNLTQGFRTARLKPLIIIMVICVRFLVLPAIGLFVVKAAGQFGMLPPDPLYHYVLMLQFTVPPAMNIGTMTQLFNVGEKECSFILMWTYLVAALALTLWSTIYMWILF